MPRVQLRPVADKDRTFLVELYSSMRETELAMLPWDDATRRAFIEQQFSAQDAHYRGDYPGATLDLVEIDGAPAGRLYVHRGEREVRIMDIGLMPAWRGQGIGSALLQDVIAEAGARRVSLYVEHGNPGARRLYERLGFHEVADAGVYLLYEKTA